MDYFATLRRFLESKPAVFEVSFFRELIKRNAIALNEPDNCAYVVNLSLLDAACLTSHKQLFN